MLGKLGKRNVELEKTQAWRADGRDDGSERERLGEWTGEEPRACVLPELAMREGK